MEKVKKNGNGELRLPPGFRFHPTDEELVVQYLKRKIFSCPLPASIIPDLHLRNSDPWDLHLPGDELERYFFSTKEAKYPNGNRSNRATNSGYWKATGLDKQIFSTCSKGKAPVLVGMKKTLVFYKGKPPHGSRTDWIMHEYRLLNNSPQVQVQGQVENWVLCRIFLKTRGSASKNGEDSFKPSLVSGKAGGSVVFYDFLAQIQNNNNPPAASSSSSSATSGITDNNESDETTCTSNTFPYFTRKLP